MKEVDFRLIQRMSEYGRVISGKLKLKGEKKKKKKKDKDRSSSTAGRSEDSSSKDLGADTAEHGNWKAAEGFSEIIGPVAIELRRHTYLKSLDTGAFVAGPPHAEGDPPAPEEILTAIAVDDHRIALKSGYGKFMTVERNDAVTGVAEAIGAREYWEPVFQEGLMALQGNNGKFLSCDDEDNVVCSARRAGTDEIIKIRIPAPTEEKDPYEGVPEEERGSLKDVEVKMIKKFQKFQDKKLRVNPEHRKALKTAAKTGALHEVLLDRREKMKADRYCK